MNCLKVASTSLEHASRDLADAGFWAEAAVVQGPGLLAWAESAMADGQCLTWLSPTYPARWRECSTAPPAVWCRGDVPTGAFLGAVGSREVAPWVARFAQDVGEVAAELCFGLVSGGAVGCDRAAAQGAVARGGGVLEVLPFGILKARPVEEIAMLSTRAPDEEFSTAAAMERNALIYAASEQTVVVQARLKAGGTWWGATEALRARRCPLVVRQDPEEPGLRALIALGGKPLAIPSDLPTVLVEGGLQPSLFAA
jgi:DNA processing protein